MNSKTGQLLDDLRNRVLEGMTRFSVPGVSVGIVWEGEEYTVCAGVTNHFQPLEVTPDTLFQIGSTTKTVTGTVIMRLVQEGVLDLDAPVRQYLPDLKLADATVVNTVTVRHLLNHTGGWVGDFFKGFGDGDDALARYVAEVHTMPQITPLGSVWHYNNAAFGIAGRVVEVMTGKSFEAATKEMILEPLGMMDSHFLPEEVMLKRFAVGHYLDANGLVQISRPWSLGKSRAPIGLLVSSVRDQLKYAKFHLSGNPSVLRDDLRLEMQRPTVKGMLGDRFGVTWWVNDTPDSSGGVTRTLRHGGATNGQMSAFYIVPEREFGFTILTNAEKGVFLHGQLSAWIQKHFLGLEAPQLNRLELTHAQLEEFAGRYVGHAFGTVIELAVQDGVLIRTVVPGDTSSVTATPAPPLPPAKCVMLEGEVVQVKEGDADGLKAEFLRGSDGQIQWLRSGGRLYAKQA
jgi:CubicO group peptidase (beta-lactamase class C family)